ncbi:MAG: DUF4845 domain-containing protein [Pseudomonadota bacterium]|nr:DUF4845 domain-containing protein [Pseudomonadota bacterium]
MKQQRGITLTSFLMVLAVIGFFLFIGMKLFPMYQEYWSVSKAVKAVAADSTVSTTPESIRNSLDKRFEVNYVDSLRGRDVKIERSAGGGALIIAEYEMRKPLIYNLDIVARFRVEETKQPAGAE